jgi:hypothetical protein
MFKISEKPQDTSLWVGWVRRLEIIRLIFMIISRSALNFENHSFREKFTFHSEYILNIFTSVGVHQTPDFICTEN